MGFGDSVEEAESPIAVSSSRNSAPVRVGKVGVE